MNGRWKIVATAGAITTLLGAYAAWQTAGLPTPAWSSDLETVYDRVDALEQFNKDTRSLLLNQEWDRYHSQLESLRLRQTLDPDNLDLRLRISDLENKKRLVEQQLEGLKK